ncbi:hypothetical protein ACRRTK_001581 [Alexandromys fortis]
MFTKRLACKPGPAPHQANIGSAGRDLCLRTAPEIVSRGAAFRRAILGEAQTMGPARWKTILSEDRRLLRPMLTDYYKSSTTL